MHLMDALSETAALVRHSSNDDPILACIPPVAERLNGAPRFLFDDAAIAAAVELTLGRPLVLREALAHIRVPYPRMWVEWSERGRARLRELWHHGTQSDQTGWAENPIPRPLPARVGFLLESEPGGRKGRATWVWESSTPEARDLPAIGMLDPHFDLDGDFPQSDIETEGLLRGNLMRWWGDNPAQLAALLSIWRTARHRTNDFGAAILGRPDLSRDGQRALAVNAIADVYGEYITIWGCLLLLTASRPAVSYTPVDLGRLNRARAKRRQAPLFDHTIVSMRLGERRERPGAPLGHARKSPRIHMVSRYLARRGDKHWLVEPYWRGVGDNVTRHVRVKG